MEFRVVLVEAEHEGNVGSIARLMKNFGLSRLWLVKPKMKLGNLAYSLAVHAADVLADATMVEDLEEALIGVQWVIGTTSIVAKKPSNLRRTAITPEELAEASINVEGEAALIFGREGSGLSNPELERCDIVVSIPSSPDYRALNVASASAIVFYELWKAQTNRGEKGRMGGADWDARKRLLQMFNLLTLKGDLPEHRRKLANKAFKNIISRAFISNREASLLMGVLRRVLRA